MLRPLQSALIEPTRCEFSTSSLIRALDTWHDAPVTSSQLLTEEVCARTRAMLCYDFERLHLVADLNIWHKRSRQRLSFRAGRGAHAARCHMTPGGLAYAGRLYPRFSLVHGP